jgi:hypothetical protein
VDEAVVGQQRVVRVGSREIDLSILPILAGDYTLAEEAERALQNSDSYQSVLAGAQGAGYDLDSVHAGVNAGLIIAQELTGVRFEFLHEAYKR